MYIHILYHATSTDISAESLKTKRYDTQNLMKHADYRANSCVWSVTCFLSYLLKPLGLDGELQGMVEMVLIGRTS